MTDGKVFLLNLETDIEQLLERIGKKHTLNKTSVESLDRVYLDTFDWRLFGSGLAISRKGGAYLLEDKDGCQLCRQNGSRKTYPLWWDFQGDELRERLQGLTDIRALIPQFTQSGSTCTYSIINSDEKTILRFTLTTAQVAEIGESEQELQQLRPVLRLLPLRGYESVTRAYTELLSVDDECTEISGYSLISAVHVLFGIDPLATSSKFAITLKSDATVSEVVRDICLLLREAMELNIGGTRLDIDSEFLHDFRVAVRRTRSLLTLMKKYLPQQSLAKFRDELKWLGTWTGPVRDLDVYFLEKERYLDMLPPSLQQGMVWFFDDLNRERKKSLGQLRRNLSSERFSTLLEDWQSFLSQLPEYSDNPKGRNNCRKTAEKIIRKRLAKILKNGDRISTETPDEVLHDLRIEAKKFRYLLEFYRSLFSTSAVDTYLKQLKKLQNNLGDFNDLSVQTTMLVGRLEHIDGTDIHASSTAAAIGGLIVQLHLEQQRVRKKFEKTYGHFASPKNIELAEKIFKGNCSQAPHLRSLRSAPLT